MVSYIKAKEGYKYALTELGFEDSRIRAKFDPSSKLYKQFQYQVPSSWIDKGYVKEVKDGK